MKKFLSIVLSLLIGLMPELSYAQVAVQALHLPVPGAMVAVSGAFNPMVLRGMTIHPENPLQFDFILDSGDTKADGPVLKEESQRLVNYFLAAMTIPRKDLWVNLSPVEKDRIVPDELIKTELGREFLAQDYLLKQFTASLIYPETALGKEFWQKVYASAQAQLGTTDIPMDTFNKVWITPENATVYEKGNTVYVTGMHLKVQLESDYKAGRSGEAQAVSNEAQELSKQVLRSVIIPVIEKEVNEGANFASLRQSMYSLVLAQWYQDAVKESVLNRAYAGQGKVAGVDVSDPANREKIYQQYMEAYKKGVFNYIKEESRPVVDGSAEVMPRKYFSGGVDVTRKVGLNHAQSLDAAEKPKDARLIRVELSDASQVGNVVPDTINEEGATRIDARVTSSGDIKALTTALIRDPEAIAGVVNKVLTTKAAGATVTSIRILQLGTNKKPVDLDASWYHKGFFNFNAKNGVRVAFSDGTWVRVSIERQREVTVKGPAALGLDQEANFLTAFLAAYGLEVKKVILNRMPDKAMAELAAAVASAAGNGKLNAAQAVALAKTAVKTIEGVLGQSRFKSTNISASDAKIKDDLLRLRSFLQAHSEQRLSNRFTMGMGLTFLLLSAYLVTVVKYGIYGDIAALAAMIPGMLIVKESLNSRGELQYRKERALSVIRRMRFQLSPATDRDILAVLRKTSASLGASLADPAKTAELGRIFATLLSGMAVGVNNERADLDLQGQIDAFKSKAKGSFFGVLETTMQKTLRTEDSLSVANLREFIDADPQGFYNDFVQPIMQKYKNPDILLNEDTTNRPLWLALVSTIVQGMMTDASQADTTSWTVRDRIKSIVLKGFMNDLRDGRTVGLVRALKKITGNIPGTWSVASGKELGSLAADDMVLHYMFEDEVSHENVASYLIGEPTIYTFTFGHADVPKVVVVVDAAENIRPGTIVLPVVKKYQTVKITVNRKTRTYELSKLEEAIRTIEGHFKTGPGDSMRRVMTRDGGAGLVLGLSGEIGLWGVDTDLITYFLKVSLERARQEYRGRLFSRTIAGVEYPFSWSNRAVVEGRGQSEVLVIGLDGKPNGRPTAKQLRQLENDIRATMAIFTAIVRDAAEKSDDEVNPMPAGEGPVVGDHGVITDDRNQPAGEEGLSPDSDNAGKVQVEGGIDARDISVMRQGELTAGVVDDAAIERMIMSSPGLKGVIIDIKPVADIMMILK
ncbi:MAG: hypothetical protein WCO69_06360 [Candidatus Omnitrophota bacterium]